MCVLKLPHPKFHHVPTKTPPFLVDFRASLTSFVSHISPSPHHRSIEAKNHLLQSILTKLTHVAQGRDLGFWGEDLRRRSLPKSTIWYGDFPPEDFLVNHLRTTYQFISRAIACNCTFDEIEGKKPSLTSKLLTSPLEPDWFERLISKHLLLDTFVWLPKQRSNKTKIARDRKPSRKETLQVSGAHVCYSKHTHPWN